jgi:hypothetical protein
MFFVSAEQFAGVCGRANAICYGNPCRSDGESCFVFCFVFLFFFSFSVKELLGPLDDVIVVDCDRHKMSLPSFFVPLPPDLQS